MSFETITFGRITNSYLNQAIIGSTMENQKKYVDLNLEYSSQKKVNTLSDAPMSITTLLNAKNDLSKIADYTSNVSLHTSQLNMADQYLNSANTDITRIYTLASGAATATSDASQAKIVATEVQSALQDLVTLANSTYNNKTLFGGASIDKAAYTVSGNNYRYQGTTDADGYTVQAQINDNNAITLNENGNNIFGEYYTSTTTVAGVTVTTTTSYGVIGHVQELLKSLNATPPDYDGIRAKLDVLQKDSQNVTYYRTKIGTSLQTLDKVKTQLSNQKIDAEGTRGDLEDANLVEVASKLQYQQFALQASLQSATKVVQNSLLNFLSST